jgi:hypothetical protein
MERCSAQKGISEDDSEWHIPADTYGIEYDKNNIQRYNATKQCALYRFSMPPCVIVLAEKRLVITNHNDAPQKIKKIFNLRFR